MGGKGITLFVLAFLPLRAVAGDNCGNNQTISSYLSAHPIWRLVEMADLVGDDQALWNRYHRGFCPGVAVAAFGDGGRSYVLALVSTSEGVRQEKLVALKPMGSQFSEKILSPPQPADQLSVVWRRAPAKSHDYATGRSVFVTHDSIIYEVMESSALQFYWSDGAFHTLETAD